MESFLYAACRTEPLDRDPLAVIIEAYNGVGLILALHSLRTGRDTQAVAFLLAPCLHVRQTQQVSEFKDYS
jgi:hypothetical protein